MKQGAARKDYSKIIHRLPGRLWIELAGLRGAKSLSGQLAGEITGVKGVKLARANPCTGSLLVIYERQMYTETEIFELARACWQRVRQGQGYPGREPGAPAPEERKEHPNNNNEGNQEDCPLRAVSAVSKPLAGFVRPENISYRRQLFNTTLVTVIMGVLGLRRLVWGASPLAGSPGLFNLSSAMTILSGYPLLRRGLRTLTAGGPVNSDLVMGAVGLTTAVLREGMLGLLVTWVGNVTALINAAVREEYARQLPQAVKPAGAEADPLAGETAASPVQHTSLPEEAVAGGYRRVFRRRSSPPGAGPSGDRFAPQRTGGSRGFQQPRRPGLLV